MLRNRSYLGEVYFRGTFHPAPHPPLVDAEIFDKAQQILNDRSEHVSHRASNSSEYLLGGVMCTACGKRFLGNAAHGRNGRYRYYTCFFRQRYGPDTCPADRLPAGELDDAVFDALLATYQRADLFDRVANDAATRAHAAAQRQRGDLANVPAELDKAEQAVSATCSRSKPAPCPKPNAASGSARLAARSPTCATARPNSESPYATPTSSPRRSNSSATPATNSSRAGRDLRPQAQDPAASACP